MKFDELFELNKDLLLPDQSRVKKRIDRKISGSAKMAAFITSACAVAAVGLVLTFFLLKPPGSALPEVVTGAINVIQSVEPSAQTTLGIKPSSLLKIKTSEDITIGELSARVEMEPAVNYEIKRVGECSYELRFKDKLQENVLYNLKAVYNGKTVYRWAFQTETVFKVTSALPEGESYVALDSAVEVTFSHVNVSGFENAFSISPAIEGTFEHYGRTWAFVPSKPFEAGKLYTVTVKKDVGGPDGVQLGEDYQFSFTTYPEGAYAYLIYQKNEAADTFLVDESPIAALCYNQTDLSKASVKVYSFADKDAYIDAYTSYVRNGWVSSEIAALAAEPFSQFETTPVLTTDYNGIYDQAAFINYPEPLPMGYYFAEIEVGGFKLYQLLQSTTLSVYTVSTNGDYRVWVNDTQTAMPVTDAKVTLEGFNDGKTGKTGTVSFSGAKEELSQRVLTVEYGQYPYVVVLDGGAKDPEVAGKNRYYSYISTGSTLYRATDTVQVFGVVLPRKAKTSVPKEVTLRCDSVGTEMKVSVASNGVFTASVPLNNTVATYGNIDLLVDDIWLTSTYFTIADYELPTYHLAVKTDRMAYSAGDSIFFEAQVTYMDGTPASGISISSGAEDISGITDENGCYYGWYPAELYNTEYYSENNGPEIHTLDFSVDNGTDEYYGAHTGFMVFGSSEYIESSYTDGTLTVEVSKVDFDRADQISVDRIYSDGYDDANYKGEKSALSLKGELHEITYLKKPAGTRYDAINKKIIYNWSYEQVDTLVREFEMNVADGIGSLEIAEKSDENRYYYVLLSSEYGTVKCYLDDYSYLNDLQNTYCLSADKDTADIGENVKLSVRDGEEKELINSGSVLYTAVCGEIVETFYSSSSFYDMKFKSEYAPDVLIYGAYFDGKHIYDLGNQYISYDHENSKLTIEMEKDQEQYSPGDEVTLTFKVFDQEGKPVKTALNISVLDRALYLISNGFEDPLYSLYGSRCFSTTVYTTCSYRDFSPDAPLYGEGGGDGEAGRDDFEDTPFFETINTDSDGKGTVTFTLPDTITEWKVLTRAVSSDVQAGMEIFDLLSTQGYFVHAALGDAVKESDDLTVAVKADGLLAPDDAENKITVGITDKNGNELETLSGVSVKSKYLYLNFGKMSAGDYTVYIQSECGTLKDAIIKDVKVEKTQSAVWIHRQEEVGDGLSLELEPTRGNVVLTVADAERSFWLKAIGRLKSNAGTRVDQVLGQYLAEEFYRSGIWMDDATLDYSIIRQYLDYQGVKLNLNNEYSDLRTTAKMAAIAPDFCNYADLCFSFERYLNDRYAARIDVLMAYFGLAALGEPVLNDLQTIYSSQSDFSAEEAAYLALAFAYGGDYSTAEYIFDSHLKDLLVNEEGKTYAALDDSVEEDLTGCITLLSNRLGLPYSESLISFIVETDTEYTLLNLELISYLNDYVNDLSGENRVTITTGDGRNETYTYQRMSELVLSLSPTQASDVRVIDVEGKSAVSYAYSGTADDLKDMGNKVGAISTDLVSSLSVGDVACLVLEVNVSNNFELPMLDLVLPEGLRFESGSVISGEWESIINAEFDRKRINIPVNEGNNTIAIWVRGAMPGEYVLEPAVITNATDNQYIASDAAEISILGT